VGLLSTHSHLPNLIEQDFLGTVATVNGDKSMAIRDDILDQELESMTFS